MSRAVVLALSGSGDACDAVLADAAGVAWQERIATTTITEKLAGLGERLLAAEQNLGCRISGIAIDLGPGAFSGTRVTAAFARAFAWGRTIPVYGLDALALLYHALPEGAPHALTVLDARRGELFAAFWRDGIRDGAGRLYRPAELAAACGEEAWLLAGTGAAALAALLPAARDSGIVQPAAAVLARCCCTGVPGSADLELRYVRGAV